MPETEEQQPWLRWDTYWLSQRWAKANLEDQKAHPELYDDDQPTTEEGWMKVYWESNALYWDDWEAVCDAITEWMDEDEDWHCEANGLGWRRLSGTKDFHATTGEELLRAILPKTDCTFSIYKEEDAKMLRIVNSHHDARGEVYLIIPDPTE